jgi:hypothetical protein
MEDMMRTRNLAFCGLLAAAVPAAAVEPVFTDVTKSAGIAALGTTLTESVAWGDYDNDGDPDLYLTNDGPNRLFRNDGGRFTDVTTSARVGDGRFGVGAVFADLDGDRDLDLYVVNFQRGLDVLYRNDGPVGPAGAFVFTDVTRTAGTTIERSSRGVVALDYDRDGLLDLFVLAIGPNILYRNLGNLRFANATSAASVSQDDQGVGAVATDLDNDGWIDLYTGNRSSQLSNVYMNSGGVFVDIAAAAGVTAAGLGMGVLAFDVDNDLDMDLYWTTWPSSNRNDTSANRLYENLGDGRFRDVSEASATDDPLGWGISGNAGDVNLDGWMDFVVTNGFSDTSAANVLFLNLGDGRFRDATAALGGAAFDGRGAAFADYDRDGDLDLVITGDEGETRLWRNDTPREHHWFGVRLRGAAPNTSAIGARVEVRTTGGSTVQEVSGGAGRGSQNDQGLVFGLGEFGAVESVTVRWPDGSEQVVRPASVDRWLDIHQSLQVRRASGRVGGTRKGLGAPPIR